MPRLIDGGSSILQSLAILRHVGRTHGLYGSSAADASRIDSLLDGLEDMRNKTRALVYGSGLSDEGFRHYVDTVLPPPPLPKASTRGSVMAIFVNSPQGPQPAQRLRKAPAQRSPRKDPSSAAPLPRSVSPQGPQLSGPADRRRSSRPS